MVGIESQTVRLVHPTDEPNNDSISIRFKHDEIQLMHDDTVFGILYQYLKIADEVEDRYWKAKLTQTLAKKYSQLKGNPDSLYLYSKLSRDQFIELEIATEVARSTMQMGIAEMNRGNRSLAMELLTKAATIAQEEEAHTVLGPTYINIASIFHQSKDAVSEISYLLKAHAISLQSNDLRNQAIASMGLRSCYVANNELDSATLFALDANRIAEELNDPMLLRYSALNLGELELAKGDEDQAEKYYLKILTPEIVGIERARGLYWVGIFYSDTEQFHKANQYLSEAHQLAESIGANDLDLNILTRWIEVLEHMDRYKDAFAASKQYMTLTDSIHSAEVRTNINELTIKYESEKKERENQELTANIRQNELEILKLNTRVKQQIFIVVSSFLLLFSILAFYFLNKKNQAQKVEIERQKNTLQKQKIEDLETKHILLSVKSLLRGQEVERSRIAKELHDGLGSVISSLKLSISQLPAFSERLEFQQQVVHTLNLADQANIELRRIAQNLMPETLDRFGLIAAIEDFIAEINFSNVVHIQFQYFLKDESLPKDLALTTYRIIQELLQNAIKHAQSTEILVQLMRHGDTINITVEDNGIGFDPDVTNQGSGFSNIKNRLDLYQGTMRLESNQGEGSTIFVEYPVTQELIQSHGIIG